MAGLIQRLELIHRLYNIVAASTQLISRSEVEIASSLVPVILWEILLYFEASDKALKLALSTLNRVVLYGINAY